MKTIKEVVLKSLSDAAYQQSLLGEKFGKVVHYVMDKIPSFPEELPEESRKELMDGYIRRKHELVGIIKHGDVEMSVHIAMSYSTHDFGRLSETHSPEYKALVKEVRDMVSTFISNSIRQLKEQAKRIKSQGNTRERSATPDFATWLYGEKGWLSSGSVRCANASKRGDPTADTKKFKAAVLAFKAVWETK